MAIQTGGYNPTNFPVYQPVQPSLLALNPSNITQGALQPLQVASALDQLKAFQAHEAEWAKLAGVRNKKLQAEADMANILAQHRMDTEQLEKDRLLAQVQHEQAVAKATGAQAETAVKTQPSTATATIAQNEALTKTVPLQADVTAGLLAGQKEAIPFLNKATVFGAQTAEGTAKFNLEQQANLQKVQDAMNKGQASQAETLARTFVNDAQAKAFETLHKLDEAKKDWHAGFTTEEKLKEAQVANQNAQADYHKAAAVFETQKQAIEEAKIKAGIERANLHYNASNSLYQVLNAQQNVLTRAENNVSVVEVNPTTGKPYTDGQLAEFYNQEPGVFKKIFGGAKTPVPPEIKSKIDRINELTSTVDDIVKRLRYHSLQQSNAGGYSAPGAAPAASIAPSPQSAKPVIAERKTVIQNGQKYTVQWDGEKWVEVK